MSSFHVSFVKCISKYYIPFDAFINGIAFLILFVDYSLKVNRNTVKFCILVLYPVTLRNPFIVLNSFSVDFLGF
jgi:hypothetical protein